MRSVLLLVAGCVGLATSAAVARRPEPPLIAPQEETRAAAARAVALVQRSVAVWDSKQTCNSCHHQALPVSMLETAARHDVPFDEAAAAAMLQKIARPLGNVDTAVQAANQIDPAMSWGTLLVAAHEAGLQPNAVTTAYARWIANRQERSGGWTTIDGRPPQSFSVISATAIAARAVGAFLPAARAVERQTRIDKARAWLETAVPRDAEDRAFQLLGLVWTGAPPTSLRRPVDAVLAMQRADGGWSQLPRLRSDAYATGQALVALHRGGVPTTRAAWQKGLRFLLDTQKPDGSWLVPTRLHEQDLVSPPYFETGFPHGPDQIISCAGTAWAAMALMESLPARASAAPLARGAPRIPMTTEAGWLESALVGSTEDVSAALAAGLNPNARTPEGTTLLMASAHDPEKVRLLLARGADVRPVSKGGHTALMIAANTRGAIASMRLLLEAGASPLPPGESSLREVSPMLYAIWSGESEKVTLLFEAGAPRPRRVSVGGGLFSATPLELAVYQQDEPMARLLVARGADVNELGESGISPLTQAVLTNALGMVRTLVSLGADVNQIDQQGETSLMHAAMIDFGDSTVLEALLAAGADRTAKSPDGLTAAAMARRYGHAAFLEHLE